MINPSNPIKTRVHYFRAAPDKMSTDHNIMLPGCHGKNAKWCKACVSVVVTEREYDNGMVAVGVSIRNDKDQFNRKIGRVIAFNRAMYNAECGTLMPKKDFDQDVNKSYSRTLNREDLKTLWKTYK